MTSALFTGPLALPRGLNLSPEDLVRVRCGLQPVFFINNFIKVRSQADPDPWDDDEDETDDLFHAATSSTIVQLKLWSKQEELINALIEYHWVLGPKSRKIGFTTAGVAFGDWVQLFLPSSRTHYISRRDKAGTNLLDRHKFSYKRLPDFLRLPIVKDNDHEFVIVGPDGDERVAQSYPATEDTAIEETADYTLLDEFASVREPLASKLWSGLEPTIAPNGYCLIISRGKGPQGTFADLVRKAVAGV